MKSVISWDTRQCSQPTFRRNISPASSKSMNRLSNIEEIFSSETSFNFCRTTRRYIP
jgi:hypothetical protein